MSLDASSFNQPLTWNVSNVADMQFMFVEETKLSLVQAKLSTALNTIEEYRSENALKTSEMNNFKDNFAKLLASVRAIIPMEMTLHYPVTLISTFL